MLQDGLIEAAARRTHSPQGRPPIPAPEGWVREAQPAGLHSRGAARAGGSA